LCGRSRLDAEILPVAGVASAASEEYKWNRAAS